MRIERIIAHATKVPRSISTPWTLGFFRHPDAPSLSSEIHSLAGRQGRLIFAGLTDPEERLPQYINDLKQNSPLITIGILLHWTEALNASPAPWLIENISRDDIFVAVDSLLSKADAESIRSRWNPKWILVTKVGLDWNELVTRRILTKNRGELFLWAPPADNPDGPFLSVDELEHQHRAMRLAHPLIKLVPVPEAWHLCSETGPCGPLARPIYSVTPEPERVLALSVIVPIRTFQHGAAEALTALLQALTSWPDSYEVIVCLDGVAWPAGLPQHPGVQIVNVSRSNTTATDWRPGYIRNLGAAVSHCRRDGLLLFCDADIQVTSGLIAALRASETAEAWHFAQLAENTNQLSWQSATSKVFAIRRFIFDRLGGFAEAFSYYGCEDNALVWKLNQAGYLGHCLPPTSVLHLRDETEYDSGLLKMHRLRRSANLFYRMMISAEAGKIYWHFFSSLDMSRGLITSGLRAALKRGQRFGLTRAFISFAVFLLALQQTDHRGAFLRGTIEAFAWRLQSVRSGLWRIPHFIRYRVLQPLCAFDFKSRLAAWQESGAALAWKARTCWVKLQSYIYQQHLHRYYHLIKANLWRIPWALAEPIHLIKANLWFFKEPMAWFRENWPWFYRSVVLKLERRRANGP